MEDIKSGLIMSDLIGRFGCPVNLCKAAPKVVSAIHQVMFDSVKHHQTWLNEFSKSAAAADGRHQTGTDHAWKGHPNRP